MSKNNKRKIQLAESESLKKKYRRLKVKEKTGMSLSTYEKLNDAIKEVEKGISLEPIRRLRPDLEDLLK